MNAPAIHEWTGPTGVKFRDVREPSGTYYHDTTPRPVIDALESARESDARVRLFTGDGKTGREWYDEWHVIGRIGRSTGPICIPILTHSNRSHGGPAILTDCIVRLIVNGREVYRHPKYKPSVFTVRALRADEKCGGKLLRRMGYTHTAAINGETQANFKSLAKAQRWVAFMKGERLSK